MMARAEAPISPARATAYDDSDWNPRATRFLATLSWRLARNGHNAMLPDSPGIGLLQAIAQMAWTSLHTLENREYLNEMTLPPKEDRGLDQDAEYLSTQQALGQICWLEIPVTDVARARKFYSELLGWEILPDVMPGPHDSPIKSMHFFRKGEALNGTFLVMDETDRVRNHDEARPLAMPVLTTFCVRDCDDSLRLVAKLGGKTLQ
ncbi:hypothetical protein S7711_09865 [Stachybotrys chartarum IBT 7711]|uniref:Glyoxalase/Bleomycin resistance-like N-terminal domain-containing protein n=1 Tax=Stachybotrys chartarum (strain CBS 109288 / IBT 7711) TaxID=1280523 RepID=A0A084AG35_STACB|nr:hypothetical protein S7711_09865 [Stachybotrys chartarum IBT 7711]